ncbi:hypothetical protein VC81_12735 [Levilactobacillus spicheri]|uniref:Sulfatase N-terminal domain-containing protein n=1 Tax=Levilactobacillus spicheri TaxID=216463 RepID=A0A0F3RSG7_9LACO|nr:hypothetical protein VC81_12735 [Levilactobacillus spicheri]
MGNDPKYYDELEAVASNGPYLNFVNNLNVKIMEKPTGYSRKNILKIEKRYKQLSKNINMNRKVNNQSVVFILSESFSNPQNVPGVSLNKNPISYTKSLIKNSVGGNMISDGYGGGTANMEYEALTGLTLGNFSATLPTPYTQLVMHQKRSNVFTINNLFPESVAIHPYSGSLYDRDRVFKKMKFGQFHYLNHQYPQKYLGKIGSNPYVSDKSAYKYLIHELGKNNHTQFIQLSTMQNHMPFNKNYYSSDRFKPVGNFSKSESQEIGNYANGIKYTDMANKYLITRLKKMKKNVTLVFYGDHLPAIYTHVNMNKHGVKMHETPYFIWSNHSKLNKSISYKALVGTYGFSSEVMQATGSKVSPYYAMLQRVNEKLPIIGSKIANTTADPNLPDGGMNLINTRTYKLMTTKGLNKVQKKLLKDYQMVQYDLTAGKHYINADFTHINE